MTDVLKTEWKVRKNKMIIDSDTIQFESRVEVIEMMEIIDKYLKAYPKDKNNEFIQTLYGKLDIMEMAW